MCGIAGFFGNKQLSEGTLSNTLQAMQNRGPDHQDYRHFTASDRHLYLLHARLSIIDLDVRSNQPFELEGCSVVYNGEIYNYLEIKKDLEGKGVRFQTSSDTEVLLQAYLNYGEDCVNHFEGMWAFALYDGNKQKLFLSRDRFAEKPLYYHEAPEGIYFGSEIKFIIQLKGENPGVNYQHLSRHLVNGYKSLYKEDDTFYQDVYEIKYGCAFSIDWDGKIDRKRYWTPRVEQKTMSLEEAIEGSRHYLLESLRLRLRADVPIAFCLSGGVDSAALASIATKIFNYDVATFSIIDTDERYNEEGNIRATIDDLGCKHTLITLNTSNMLERLKDLIQYHDAPVATITYLVHSMLSEQISGNGYRVAFSGTSADELFTGYYDHFNLHLYEMRNHPEYQQYLADWNAHTGRFVRNPYFKNPDLYLEDPNIREHIYLNRDIFTSYLKSSFDERFKETYYSDSLLRNRMMNELFHEATPLILHEDDLNSMRYSVENRSPFLDTNLFEFAYSIPNEHLIRDGYGKYILREAVKGILNDQVRLDRQKKGFNASLNSIVNLQDPQSRDLLLADSPVFDLVDRSKIESVMNKEELPNSFSKFLFNFINVKFFLEFNS